MTGRFADAVIVAAGSSTRMGGVDKLNEPLLGRPLLAWSVEAMAQAETVARIVLVTRADNVDALRSAPWLNDRVSVVSGGEQRTDSVRVGVNRATADVVLVHDGARPLGSAALADAVARAAAEHGAAVPVVSVADSLKRAEGSFLFESVNRHGLVRTQTPQGARRQLLLQAFEATGAATFTDEAALLQANGVKVATVPGEATNLKVTDPDDLAIVRAIAASRVRPGVAAVTRIGFGEDTHPFGPGDGLMLGGTEIDGAPRLYGHSDGDVVLHALATAILAAVGQSDLGRLFPSSDRATKWIASDELISAVMQKARETGWVVDRAQVSIVGARPRLGGLLGAIARNVARLVGAEEGSVAITASTGNLSGPEGAGRVISATALVTLVRR